MKKPNLLLGLILLLAVILTACSANQNTDNAVAAIPANETAVGTAAGTAAQTSSTPEPIGEPAAAPAQESLTAVVEPTEEMPRVSWMDHEFTDAVSGETFKISDFKGKVVLVEFMTMRSAGSLDQQNILKELRQQLGGDDLVMVGLNIDPDEDLAMLAAYAQFNGFDWLYSAPPPEITLEIGYAFGSQFHDMDSAPIVIIDITGGTHPLPAGLKSVDDLLKYLELYSE